MLRYSPGARLRYILPAFPGPTQTGYPVVATGGASLTPMTSLQQGLIHLGLVLIAIIAIVVLAATGNGNNTVYGLILAISGFGNIGAAALPSVGTTASTPPPPASKPTSPA